MKSRILYVSLVLLLLPIAGCGGGGGGDDQQLQEQQVTLDVVRALSGFLSENGFESDDNDALVGTIPDISGYLEERGILTFDLSAIPADATLVSAELRTLQGAPTGTPYSQVVQVIVDHINGLAPGVNFADFATTPLSVITAPPLSDNALQEVKTLDVTSQVADDLAAARGESKFRLRGQAINPLTAGNNDPIDPVDLARFQTDTGETTLVLVIQVPVQNP